jgi:hypothetical protein
VKYEHRPTSLTVDRFTITTATGDRFTGAIRGAGGVLTDLADVERAIRQAPSGRPLGAYEPKPGHVVLLADYNVWSDGPETFVDIRGATAERAVTP